MKLLVYTSLLTIGTGLVGLSLGRWTDASILIVHGSASAWHHSHYTPLTLVIDRITIGVILCRAIQYAAKNGAACIGLYSSVYGYIAFLYFYGMYTKRYCFDPNPATADLYHASMHVIAAAVCSGTMIWLV